MGCGGSTDSGGKTSEKSSPSDYKLPQVNVTIGKQVQKADKEAPKLVFIFGGPGSRKGRIVDDLTSMYGFHVINAEELILEKLPKKVEENNSVNSTRGVQELLHEDPSLLTLEWVFQVIKEEMDCSPSKCYLIDIMPNLKFMLKVDTYVKDCSTEMKQFEQMHPVSFALNLATIPSSNVIKNIEETPKVEKEKEGATDEVDSLRTQKRQALYEESVNSFLQYFSSSDRLVTVDVSCGVADLIWNRVSGFFAGLNFSYINSVNTVMVFAFDPGEFVGLDMGRYRMTKITLAAIAENPLDSVEKLLEELCIHINKIASYEAFAVELHGTSITKDSLNQFKKRLVFLEVEQGYLDKYIYVARNRRSRKNSLYSKQYKAVCSTDNEIYLFPLDTDTELCKRLSLCFAETKEKQCEPKT